MNKKILSLLFSFLLGSCVFAKTITDEFVEATLKTQDLQQPEIHSYYDYTCVIKLPVKLAITENIKSENDVYEGQELNFTVRANVSYDGKIIIKKDTPVIARVETIIKSGMNGIPATIILGDFKIANVEKGRLDEFYEIKGQDRSLLVFPLKWALTILPPTGSLTNFIKGGHAKLKTVDHITIYYHPNWI
ncbi:hypothetical protein IJZ97_06160 [bacterium]|nr:hypothetical protein [bacterium]